MRSYYDFNWHIDVLRANGVTEEDLKECFITDLKWNVCETGLSTEIKNKLMFMEGKQYGNVAKFISLDNSNPEFVKTWDKIFGTFRVKMKFDEEEFSKTLIKNYNKSENKAKLAKLIGDDKANILWKTVFEQLHWNELGYIVEFLRHPETFIPEELYAEIEPKMDDILDIFEDEYNT